jgi:hypothetical protein
MKTKINEWNAVFTLHRYWIWANRMRKHFDDHLGKEKKKKDEFRKKIGMGFEEFMYMSLWYALLYVVIEGWKRLGLVDTEIDRLLHSLNVNLLKRYRNGVFHYQKGYIDERFIGFIRDGKNCVSWVRELNTQLGRFFLMYFNPKKHGKQNK